MGGNNYIQCQHGEASQPVASANSDSDPFGTGTSLIGGCDSGFVKELRDELHDATRVGRCEIKRGGSTSARQTNTIEMSREGGGSGVPLSAGVLVTSRVCLYARA
jgi:hypothetical protein